MTDPVDHCPYCGYECWAYFENFGYGPQQVGPFHCDFCGAVEIGPYDCTCSDPLDADARDAHDPSCRLAGLMPGERSCGWYRPPTHEELKHDASDPLPNPLISKLLLSDGSGFR